MSSGLVGLNLDHHPHPALDLGGSKSIFLVFGLSFLGIFRYPCFVLLGILFPLFQAVLARFDELAGVESIVLSLERHRHVLDKGVPQ